MQGEVKKIARATHIQVKTLDGTRYFIPRSKIMEDYKARRAGRGPWEFPSYAKLILASTGRKYATFK
jgi:hypothetical protein